MHNDYVWTFKVCRDGICQSIIPALPGESGKNHEEPRSGLPTQRDWEKSRRTSVRIANIKRLEKITKNLGQDCQHRETGKNHEEPRSGLPTQRDREKSRRRIANIEFIISIQPQRPDWQEPEPSHVTGMALAHCILGTFLGVVCHCFPRLQTFPFSCTSATTREILVAKGGTVSEKDVRQFCLNSDFDVNLGIFYVPRIYDMEPTALLPLRKKAC